MKAKRRHELRENELAHAFMVARDYLQENGSKIGLVAVIALAIVAAVTFTVRSRAAAIEDVWHRRNELKFEDPVEGKQALQQLEDLTAGVNDKTFVLLSLIDQGQEALRLAQKVDNPPDPDLNQMAEEAFKQLLARFPQNPLALGVALNGLASVEENKFLLDGDMAHKEKCREYLTRVIDNPLLNGMPFQQVAIDRRKSLASVFQKLKLVTPPPPPETEAEPPGEFKFPDTEPPGKP